MNLLQQQTFDGYPPAYLLARLCGRRSLKLFDWQHLLTTGRPPTSEGTLWRDLLQEFSWVYRQLNPRRRRELAAFFGWFEIRTLALCLRHVKPRESSRIKELLEFSLLSNRLQKPLLELQETASAVSGLAGVLTSMDPCFEGLEKIFAEQGLRAFETELTNRYLQKACAGRQPPLVARFFCLQVDLRNLLLLYKQLRWQMGSEPERLLDGGTIAHRRLSKVSKAGDMGGVTALIGKRPTQAETVETELLRRITTLLHRAGRQSEGLGPVMDYLWRHFIAARNLRLLIEGEGLERTVLAEELIT